MSIATVSQPAQPREPTGAHRQPAAIAEQLVSLVAPTSIAAEQYRSLRYNI